MLSLSLLSLGSVLLNTFKIITSSDTLVNDFISPPMLAIMCMFVPLERQSASATRSTCNEYKPHCRKAANCFLRLCVFASLRRDVYAQFPLDGLRLAAIAALRHAIFTAICGKTANHKD